MTADPLKNNELPSFELKGSMFTVTVLHVLRPDLDALARQLAERVAQAPALFRHVPVVIDLRLLREEVEAVDLARLVLLLGDMEFVPIGVRNGNEAQNESARQFGLATFSDSRPERDSVRPVAEVSAPKKAPPPTKVITQPVRSGQQIYAQGGDLIVVAKVSAGAEILADGNIHVYGPLCGRALAGVQGDESARIFCQHLQAELVSVAGQYRLLDDIDPALRGRPVQIHLQDTHLKIDIL